MKQFACLALFASLASQAADAPIVLPLRSRIELFKGSGEWHELKLDYAMSPRSTALILCDLWDKHWCRGATARVNALAPRVAKVVDTLRSHGVLIIHAPSDTMKYYENAPQRRAMIELSKVAPPQPLNLPDPKLPIDDSGSGCDTKDKMYIAWTQEHPAVTIAPTDLISDKGEEVYSALKRRGIQTLLVAGVHTNMCILNRTFAIKNMTRWGVRTILIRDLTDAMYDPDDAPRVSHERGTELVIEHIERFWAPTILSSELVSALGRR